MPSLRASHLLRNLAALGTLAVTAVLPATSQVLTSRERILFSPASWHGERFPDGRPRLPDTLLDRALAVSLEDLWDFLKEHKYNCQYEGGWQSLHPDQPFAGRALTAQYLPQRPDLLDAITAEGKTEGRKSGNNSWPINELTDGDVYVADGYGKIIDGTLIGSNLGSGIAAHVKGSGHAPGHGGFVFDAGIRDAEENREIAGLNGLYRGYDPSYIVDMTLNAINAPIRIGRATVLPGDLVVAKRDGVIFIPAALAEEAVASAEFTKLQDTFNFERNRSGSNGAEFEGGWTEAKYKAFVQWIDAHPQLLRMPRAEFDAMVKSRRRD